MRKDYPYLNDIAFLNKIYSQHNRTTYINITVLSWDEKPLQTIEGRVTSASMSVNGDSSVRRTANLNIKIIDADELYNNIDSLFSINKKIFIETGLANGFAHLGNRYYSSYPIIWFPFGTMVIQNYSITHDLNGVNISLSLSDKMCLLNGEAGGIIPASTNFESVDTLGTDGDLHSEWLRINEIIPELVHHFGGEAIDRIIVADIPNQIQQVMRWVGSNPLYLWELKRLSDDTGDDFLAEHQSLYTTIESKKFVEDSREWTRRKINNGYDAGYIFTDFTYPGELTAGAGDSVCTVLDKIKNTLGNFEYYYDVFGNFIFQEIKNYINTTQWKTLYQEIYSKPSDDGSIPVSTQGNSSIYLPYITNTTLGGSAYNFNNTDFIISCNNSPQFNMIKNDFIVWGARTTTSGQKLPVRYHLAIDTRPDVSEDFVVEANICFDTDMYDRVRKAHPVYVARDGLVKPMTTFKQLLKAFPQGTVGRYYAVFENGETTRTITYTKDGVPATKEITVFNLPNIYTWVTDVNDYNAKLLAYQNDTNATFPDGFEIPTIKTESEDDLSSSLESTAGYVRLPFATYYSNEEARCIADPFVIPANSDWRDRLYFQGLIASQSGLEANYYWSELCNEWPKIYDVENSLYYKDVLDLPTSLDYWLDLIDNDSVLNEFSVENIGRRSYAKVESDCNCVFEPDIPNAIMAEATGDADTMVDSRSGMTVAQARDMGMMMVQVDSAIYDSIVPGGVYNSCYQNVRQLIQDYTDYNNTISISCLPIYHLEPNTRIHINDPESGINGDYLITSISFNLGNDGTMSISAKKVNEKI